MFEFLKGTLCEAAPTSAVLDVKGVGYLLSISLNTYSKLPSIGSEVQLFVSLVVREDSHTLYGFLTKKEREFFCLITQISGIGPKIGLALLGHMPIEQLKTAILTADTPSLVKVPQIGKKLAERLILELKDKVKQFAVSGSSQTGVATIASELSSDAVNALVHLGYSTKDAQQAVDKILLKNPKLTDLSQLITLSLRNS